MEPTQDSSALRPGEDPRERARALRQVRDAVLGGGSAAAVASPRAVIAASWRRVGTLDPSGGVDVEPLDGDELARRRSASGLLEVMPLLRQRLLPAAEAAGQIMVVSDVEGRVLWREGGPSVRRRADALGFVEGSAWDEGTVGTNAIGTALVVGRPVHVFAAEHYAETHQPWTCAAAPLHDPMTGRLLGAVDLSGPAHTVHASTVALVDAVTRLVAFEVRAAHERRHAALREVGAALATGAGALVVADDGCVVAGPAEGPHRLTPPEAAGEIVLPGLGRRIVEPLPGGWLVHPARAASAGPVLLVLERQRLSASGAAGTWTLPLTPRHAQILFALAGSAGGLTAAALAQDLFGDPTRTVTVRAEMSRLRRALGPLLAHQPYRFAEGVSVEVRS